MVGLGRLGDDGLLAVLRECHGRVMRHRVVVVSLKTNKAIKRSLTGLCLRVSRSVTSSAKDWKLSRLQRSEEELFKVIDKLMLHRTH